MLVKTAFLVLLACLSLSVGVIPVVAHPGHDHSIPSGNWPEHTPDSSPGVESAVEVEGASGDSADIRISSWKLADGSNGTSSDSAINNVVSNVLADVNTVAYNNNYVFIRTTGIPSHALGPFNNPSVPGDADATYRISCSPTEETGTKTSTGLGSIGVMVNGAGFFNASDGTFWIPNTNGLTNPGAGQPPNSNWSTNALWYRAVELQGMDDAGGHPAPVNGETNPDGSTRGFYHYHRSPIGLLDQIDPGNNGQSGSPIIGFAFDGYPIVGPFAYADDTLSSAVQMISSYRAYDDRSSFPNPKPTVEDYAMGSFLEDFFYDDGSGNLNEFNMAFVKFSDDGRAILTDETDPDGDWAYFATLDSLDGTHPNDIDRDADVSYPYIVGPEYYGVVDTVMTSGGNINVPGNVTYYFEYENADFDSDNDVDGVDFLTWQRGNSPNPLSSSDLLNWEIQYGAESAALPVISSVPEPNTVCLVLFTLFLCRSGFRNTGCSKVSRRR